MLIGYGWTFVYSIVLELEPQSLVATSEVARNDYVDRILQPRYFSFMTLTTVGYGDIVPHSPAARTMTILEAVMGQFYLVALVGRLVGLHIVHGSDPRSRV
jgi:voltage-gated potassium channel